MTEKRTSGIICSIRGGVESKATIDRAVALAHETSLPLYFLYVVNLELIRAVGGDDQDVLVESVQDLGYTVLGAASARARRQGIESQGIVRNGDIEAEIFGLCQDLDAKYLILGQSPHPDEEHIYSSVQLKRLAERTGMQVEKVIVRS